MVKLDILYEDKDIIVCHKAPGVSSQTERSYDPDMVSLLMNHFHKAGEKNPYVGVVHRLDKPVAGVIVYGKNEQATKALSEQITHHQFTKRYYAIVCGAPDTTDTCTFADYLLRDAKTNTSSVVAPASPVYKNNKEIKKSSLSFNTIKTVVLEEDSPFYRTNCPYDNKLSLVDIDLHTGRHHQIRVQFAHHGLPLWGDQRYSPYAKELGQRQGVALCAHTLTITHPTTKKEMTFSVIPSNSIFKKCFDF